mmetsp:Transcript_7534/g.13624  ORF Transcript_7534/g.13624 Transcript_7534/m.13624 type:complete len:176 (+) Transcript_7534:109-636(+)
MESLVEMGFDETQILRGLEIYGGDFDQTLEWLMNGGVSESDSNSGETDNSDDEDEVKLVLVVRKDLFMGTGKIAAQCSHATMGIAQKLYQTEISPVLLIQAQKWSLQGEKTIVLWCAGLSELKILERQGTDLGLLCEKVRDAGRTEVEPGSVTVLALFGYTNFVDQVTGQLQLLR